MNIAIIKRKYQAEGGGGAENYARYIVKGLINKGHKIFLVSKDFKAQETESLKHIPVKVSKITSSSGTTAFHKGTQSVLKKAMGQYEIDVTYALSRTFPVDVFRVTEQIHIEWMNLNYSSIHKHNPRHKGILNLEKNIFQTSNTKAVVVNSLLSRELIIKHYNFPKNKIHVLSNGINSDFFSVPGGNDAKAEAKAQLLGESFRNKFIMLFVATNFHIKGLDYAVKAIGQLPEKTKRNCAMLVLGGDKPDKYKKLAAELGIGNSIIFLGACNNTKLYYSMSDLLVYPSLGEPFGNVCLEAAAAGLPIITTKQNGSCEVVTEGRNGYLLEKADQIDKLTNSIEKIYSLPEKQKQKFSKISISTAKKYNWEKHLNSLERILTNIAQ